MSPIYPDPGETLRDLVRRVLPDLEPGVRAGVQVVTGGTRAGLVVPQHAPPVSEPPTPEAPVPDPPAVEQLPDEDAEAEQGPSPKSTAARRSRRRTNSKETS